jgi:DNA cross-link repair 1A protein
MFHNSLQYDFPKQEAVIQFVIDAIQAEAFNPQTLFLIGSYTIGRVQVIPLFGHF